VVWNDHDNETAQERQNLEILLNRTFSRTRISRDVIFHPAGTETELRTSLGDAIDEVKRRIDERARLLRGEIVAGSEAMPKLPTAGSGSPPAARP
jgi:hypothetical protein